MRDYIDFTWKPRHWGVEHPLDHRRGREGTFASGEIPRRIVFLPTDRPTVWNVIVPMLPSNRRWTLKRRLHPSCVSWPWIMLTNDYTARFTPRNLLSSNRVEGDGERGNWSFVDWRKFGINKGFDTMLKLKLSICSDGLTSRKFEGEGKGYSDECVFHDKFRRLGSWEKFASFTVSTLIKHRAFNLNNNQALISLTR